MKFWMILAIVWPGLALIAKDDLTIGRATGATDNRGRILADSDSIYRAGTPVYLIFEEVQWDRPGSTRQSNVPGHPDLPPSLNTINVIDFETSLKENNEIRLQFAAWTENQVTTLRGRTRQRVNPQGARKEFAKKRWLQVEKARRHPHVYHVRLDQNAQSPVNPYHCLAMLRKGQQPMEIPEAGDSFRKGRVSIRGMCCVAQFKVPFDAQVRLFGSRFMKNHIPNELNFSDPDKAQLPRYIRERLTNPNTIVAAIYFSDRPIPAHERAVSDFDFLELQRELDGLRRPQYRLEVLESFAKQMGHRQFSSSQARGLLLPESIDSRAPARWRDRDQLRAAARIILERTETDMHPEDFAILLQGLGLSPKRDILLQELGTNRTRHR